MNFGIPTDIGVLCPPKSRPWLPLWHHGRNSIHSAKVPEGNRLLITVPLRWV